MSQASAQERRQRKRFQKSCEVEFSVNNETYRGVSENFSINGLFIKTNNFLALQSVVAIKVHLPDGSTAKLEGRVRRVQQVSYDIVAASGETFKRGIGIEIIKRDSNYMKFFISLLGNEDNTF